MSNPNHPGLAFTLRIASLRSTPTDQGDRYERGPLIVIRAYDDLVPGWDSAGRVRLTVEVSNGGKVVFPRGQLTCALHGTSDGIEAKELVMSLVAMRPGDTDADYFEGYTPEQLAWVTEHGEALDMERQSRYCDQNSNVRKSA